MKRRLLIVDDELAILLTLKTILEINGFVVDTASSAKEGVAKLKANEYQMVISDMRMESEKAGFDVVRAARKQKNAPVIALLTAHPLLDSDWKTEGADSMLVKPMDTSELLRQLEALLVSHENKKNKTKGMASTGKKAAA